VLGQGRHATAIGAGSRTAASKGSRSRSLVR